MDKPDHTMQLYIYTAKQCNPRVCTGARILRHGLAKPIFKPERIPHKSIVLNPLAQNVLSPLDSAYNILTALDCSWNQAINVLKEIKTPNQRILPILIAANPLNYGKLTKLTTAEALAAALHILGKTEQSMQILGKFKWGPEFFNLNENLLNDYAKCRRPEEVLKVQSEYFQL